MTSQLDHNLSWFTNVPPEDMRRIGDALYRVHYLMAHLTDLDTLLERIMSEGKEVARAEACSLMLYDPQSEELYFEVAMGETGNQQALKQQFRLKLNEGIAGAAARTRSSINVPDVERDPRFCRAPDDTIQFTTRSLVAVPLVDRDTLIGVIEVINKRDSDAFSESDLRVMEIFSSVAGTAIANARLIEENMRAERLAAIGEAVAGLSHYTKNLVNGLTTSVELMEQSLEQEQYEVLKRGWNILKRSTRKIAHVVEDMLAFSKPREPECKPVRLERLMEEVMDTLWALTNAKSIDLRLDLDGVTAPVYGDHQTLYRGLLNLVVNAADAVPKENGAVRLRAWTRPDGGTTLAVEDNGPGVPPELRQKVLEPFFSTKGSNGTGLGLAVTHKIVLEHEGKLAVEDNAEGGARFRIELPPPPANETA